MKRFIGTKAFYKNLIVVALPIVLQQLITSSLQLVDNIMVGSLGEQSIGAVSVVNQLYFVVILITFGAIGGAGIYTAQYFGSKDFDKLKQTFRFKIVTGLIVAFLSLFIFTILGKTLISAFSENPDTIGLGQDYLRIVRFSIFPWALTVAISNTFREIGITKQLLYISFIAIITNTILNYLFIFGNFGFPKLGVEGAGIATLISRFVEFGLMLVLIRSKGSVFSTKLRDLFKIDQAILKAIIIMALPLMLNEALWSMGQTMFLQSYSLRGDNALAAMNIASAISQLVFVTFGGIGTGVAVLVGNTLGKNELEEAKDNSVKLIAFAVVFAFFMGILLFIVSFFVLDLYDVSEVTKNTALWAIRTNALFIPIYSFNVAIYFTLRAGGDTKSTLLMDAGFMWVVSVPIAVLLSRLTNLSVILLFLIVQLSDIPKMMFAIHRYKKKHWVRNLALAD